MTTERKPVSVVRCDQPSEGLTASFDRQGLFKCIEHSWRKFSLTQPMRSFSDLPSFSCRTLVQPNRPDRYSEPGFQSREGEKVGVSLSCHRSGECFASYRTPAGSFVDREVPFVQGCCKHASNRAGVLGRYRANNSAGRPLSRHQVVHRSAHRLVPPSHAARLRRLGTSRNEACQIAVSRWVQLPFGITAVSFT